MNMTRKQARVSSRMVFVWFILIGFIFLLAPQSLTNKFQFAFVHIFRWPLRIGRNISLSARTERVLTDVVSRREHNQLQNYLANVTEELLQKHKKVEKLSKLRDRLYAMEGAKLMTADIITASTDGHNELIINRGEIDGLGEGQFVLGDNSIIGGISEVSPRTAKVRLITDPSSKIAVKLGKLETVIQGDGNGSVKVPLLSIKHKIEIGQEVFACKKPGFLDSPVIIGTVAQCKRDDENPILWDIMVKPACDISKLTDVAVIIMNPKE